MSTPIETNTEELREILNEVYSLPNRSTGGSSEPDLIIGLNIANTKVMSDDGSITRDLERMTVDDVSIVSGSVSDVTEKVRQGQPVKVLLRDIHFYTDDMWYQNIGEANYVMVLNNTVYPNENANILVVTFFLSNMGISSLGPCFVRIEFNPADGNPTEYYYNMLSVE